MANNTIRYQVTLYDKSNKYKPVSCIITCEPKDLTNKDDRKWLIHEGTLKICRVRRWGAKELTEYNYLKAKVRDYDEAMKNDKERAKSKK